MNLHVDHRFKLYRLGLGELAEDDVPQGAGGLVHHHVHVSVHLQEDLLAHSTLEEVQIVKLSAKFRESFTTFKVTAYSLLLVPTSTFTLKNLFCSNTRHYAK